MRSRALSFVLMTVGCAYISDEDEAWRLDPDDDGVPIGQDCDDERAALGAPQTFYADVDGDGYGDPAAQEAACAQPEGFVANGEDCDDGDAGAFPGNEETWYDGVDADCAGDDDFDQDGDGYAVDTDCDDTNPALRPDASIEEEYFNGVDDNCDLSDGDGDEDGDGYWASDYVNRCNGNSVIPMAVPDGREGDCWDDPAATPAAQQTLDGFADLTAPEVNPGVSETWYDGADQDCAGDDDFDQDGDGVRSDTHPDGEGLVGEDCDDTTDSTYPGAPEEWYDGVDADCSGDSDFDRDGDGFACSPEVDSRCSGDDCDDTDPTTNPGASDDWYDGIDSDCQGNDDFDRDGDGYASADYAGNDCDDGDPTVNPAATEVWYDGDDQDCDGSSDYDQDGDGYDSEAESAGGTDCDDTEPLVNPGQAEVEGDGLDNDCSGDANGNGIYGQASAATADGAVFGTRSGQQTGYAVSAAGDVNGDGFADVLIGAPTDSTLQAFGGAAFLMLGPATGSSSVNDAALRVYGGNTADLLGWGLTELGDQDGDGYGDFAVGSYNEDVGDSGDGGVRVFLGPITGMGYADSYDSALYAGPGSGASAGYALASGDLDDDGTVDLIVGGSLDDVDGTNAGRVWVVAGPATGGGSLGSAVALSPEDGDGDRLGTSAVSADLTGDGVADLVVSAPQLQVSGSAAGGVYVLEGPVSAAIVVDGARTVSRTTGTTAASLYGTAVSAGDVTGDGYADLLSSSPSATSRTGLSTGAVYVFAGPVSTSGTAPSTADAVLYGRTDNGSFGWAADASGDADGDGTSDLVVGAPTENTGGSASGSMWLLTGPLTATTAVSTTTHAHRYGASGSDQFGQFAVFAGDVDADGFGDVLVGAPGEDTAASASGAAFLFLGGAL